MAEIGEGTAEDVIRHIEQLDPEADHKPMIAATHEVLTGLYQKGLLTGHEEDGHLIFNLHKIIQPNSDATDPDLWLQV